MQTEIKEKWVKALRSGEYEQNYGDLYKAGNFCCLGVLAEIIGIPGKEQCTDTYYELENKTELTSSQRDKCARLNDFERKTFAEIADYVEANL